MAGGEKTIELINKAFSVLFKETIVRASVPAFFMISGALFFRDYTNEKYAGKMRSRFFSLVVPYLIWDTVWMIFNIVISHSFISNYFIGREIYSISIQSILLGIFHYKGLAALWFVFDLIVFATIAPVLNLLLSRKAIGIICIVTVTVLAQFGIVLPEAVFFRWNFHNLLFDWSVYR